MNDHVQFILITTLSTIISGQCPENCTCSKMGKLGYFVDCSNRGLKEIPTNIPFYTTNLDISRNLIKNFTNSTFYNLKNMTALDASKNILEDMEIGTFHRTRKLKTVNLSENQLEQESFLKGLFAPLKQSLQELDISRNPQISENNCYPDESLGDLANLEILSMDCLNGEFNS